MEPVEGGVTQTGLAFLNHFHTSFLEWARMSRALGAGSVVHMSVPSLSLGSSRGVHVYIPPSYRTNPLRRYPVLYMHDGQNAFSSPTGTTFGWGSWELDLTVDALCHARRMQEVIMVAVDSSPARLEEYNGQRRLQGGSRARTAFEKYEAFLTSELKPLMDREYHTLPKAECTAVMGSSMGGLCSLVLAWDHPETFGGVASLSGAFPADLPNLLDDAMGRYNGPRKPFRVYLDSGVAGPMGGDDGRFGTERVAAELRRMGWTTDDLEWFVDKRLLSPAQLKKSGLSRTKWAEAKASQHNELYWRRRVWRALTFLFPPPRK
jgi:enterochelin esterase-like enzyme